MSVQTDLFSKHLTITQDLTLQLCAEMRVRLKINRPLFLTDFDQIELVRLILVTYLPLVLELFHYVQTDIRANFYRQPVMTCRILDFAVR